MNERQNVPVLIAGAGPAGLVAGIALARHGVEVLLVERRANGSSLPRATAISTRTMEILRSWGLAEAVRAQAMDVVPRGFITPTLATPQGMELQLGFPTEEEAAALSPAHPACAPQDQLEAILLDQLRTYDRAHVRFGTELVDLEDDGDGVTVSLRDAKTGDVQPVRAGYVVGADGAWSTVRRLLGITLNGPDDLARHTTTLFRAPLWHVASERRYGIYVITHPDADGMLVPCGRDDRWLYGRERPSDAEAEPMGAQLVERIRLATGVPDLEPEILRTGEFTFAAQLADIYRVGRGFVVGDAAHRITPRGGTGMNTAIHDGYDLGWKLAWVCSGWAGPELLDRYEAERRPVGAQNVARSARPDGAHRAVADALAEDFGGRIAHSWLPRHGLNGDANGPAFVSTLDLLGAGFTVLTGPADTVWAGAARAVAIDRAATVPITVHQLDHAAAHKLGVEPVGALVVRPDGQPVERFGVPDSDPVSAMDRAMATLTGRLPVSASCAR